MGNGDEVNGAGFVLSDEQYKAPAPNRRAAVIVGVSTSAGLPRLASAGPMARSLGDWLARATPSYDVTVITDEEGHEVTRAEIFKAIRKYVTVPARYELLLVHYIGHGFYQARNDIWMLSDLPVDRAACISLAATLNDAKFCGIPNVVVVSDACRSLPGDVGLIDLDASSIIPQYPEYPVETSCVDYFQATGRGTPAFEGEINGARRSFLSHAFREAYRQPRPEMVRSIRLPDGAPILVVPNRRLSDFLQQEVTRALGQTDALKSQQVVSVVPSDDSIFIAPAENALVRGEINITTDKAERPGRVIRDIRDIVDPSVVGRDGDAVHIGREQDAAREAEIDRLLVNASRENWPVGEDPLLRFAPPSGLAAQSVADFETQTGLTLTGATIARAAMTGWPARGGRVEHAPEKDRAGLSVLRVVPSAGPVGELALALEDGRSLILPVMEGYICHVALDATGVQSLAFVPSRSSWRNDETDPNRLVKIERLRALAAQAMDGNRFQIRSPEEAKSLADAIRIGKASDPVLGLFAAQAYSDAAMPERVRSISEYMHDDIHADLFDVRLVSNRFWQENQGYPVVPRCPMLTQNWALLGPRRAPLPAAFSKLRHFLTDALWTTFASGAAKPLFDAIESGDL